MRRSALVFPLACVLLAACSVVAPEPARPEFEPAGIQIGEGQLDGVAWSAWAVREGTMLCIRLPVHQESSCTSPIEPPRDALSATTVPGESTPPSTLPKVVRGLARGDVARVRIESDVGTAEADVVSIAALGVPANAYAVALPAGARITALVALRPDGSEAQRIPW